MLERMWRKFCWIAVDNTGLLDKWRLFKSQWLHPRQYTRSIMDVDGNFKVTKLDLDLPRSFITTEYLAMSLFGWKVQLEILLLWNSLQFPVLISIFVLDWRQPNKLEPFNLVILMYFLCIYMPLQFYSHARKWWIMMFTLQLMNVDCVQEAC